MDFKPGVYEGLSYDQYASIEAWRSHDLTQLIRCPYTWKFKRDISESPALLEGRVQHTVFSELDKFDEEFAIEPAVDRRTKVGKEAYAEWLESLGDRTPIKEDLYNTCIERRHVLSDYIPGDQDKVELVICWEWHGQPYKGRMDWYDGQDIWDLKTCRDASPRGFKSAINNFLYYQQAAFYLTGARAVGLAAEQFYFLAIEKAHPYPFNVYTLSDEAIAYGDAKNEQALSIGLECQRTDEWLPYGSTQKCIEFDIHDLY